MVESAQFKMENVRGADRVALFQPMPKPVKDLIADEALLIKMLHAQGKTQYESIKMGDKVEGTTHTVQHATLTTDDAHGKKELPVIMKFNKGGSMEALTGMQWREAYFYSEMSSQVSIENAEALILMVDKETGQYFLMTSAFKDAKTCQEIYIAKLMGTDLTSFSPNCNFTNAVMKTVQHLARLHSSTYMHDASKKDWIKSLDGDLIPSSKWIFGEGKESFGQINESLKLITNAAIAKGEGLQKGVTNVPDFIEASNSKVDFDAFYANTKEGEGIPHSMIMGSYFSWGDVLWVPEGEKVRLVDFEHVAFGPIVADVAILMAQTLTDDRIKIQEKVLQAYFDELKAIGKIKTDVYTFDRLKADVSKYMVPSAVARFAKANLKGDKGFLTMYCSNCKDANAEADITVDKVVPSVLTNLHIIDKPKAAPFELQMETGPDGKQRVKMFQPVPFTVAEATSDEDVTLKLLKAQGMDVKEVKISDKITGGMSQEVKSFVAHMNDGSEKDILLKINKEGAAIVVDQWREALFFQDIYNAPDMAAFRAIYKLPQVYVILIDKDTGRQVILMELLTGDRFISYEKMLGHFYGNYEHFGQRQQLDKKPIEEICGSNITIDDALLSIVSNLAALHYFTWDDKTLYEKYPYIRMSDFVQGKNEEEFKKLVDKQDGQIQPQLTDESNLNTDYPELNAIIRAAFKKSSFQEFQDAFINDQTMHISINHGDAHDRQCVWSKDKQAAFVFDYELMRFGHPVSDLCYFWLFIRLNHDLDIERMMQHYHKTLISFGDKVTADSYSYEQCYKDFGRMFFPTCAGIVPFVYAVFKDGLGGKIVKSTNLVVEKFGITPENVLPNYNYM